MSNIAIVGLPNHTAQPYMVATVPDAAYQPAEMEVDFLKTEEPTDRARLTTLDPRKTMWQFESRGLPLTYDGFALVNHNLYPGSQVRWIGSMDSLFASRDPLRLAPSAILASTNLSGVVGSVDEEISAADAVYIGPTTTTSSWFVRFSFPTPTPTLHTGDGMLSFVLRMRRVFTGAGATSPRTIPTVILRLFEAGSLIRIIGSRAITATGGQLLIFPFSVGDLSVASGADIECHLEVTPGVSDSGGSYAQLDTISLYYEVIPGPFYDSGWIPVEADARPAPFYAPRYLHYFPDTAWTTVTGYSVMVRSDQAVHDPPTTNTNSETPEGAANAPLTFVDAGISVAGVAAKPVIGIAKGAGPFPRVEVIELGGNTAGGQSYGADAVRRLITDPMELIVTREELAILQDQLAYRRGRSGGIYVAMEPGVAAIYQAQTSFWCTLKEMSAPVAHGRYRADGSMRYKVSVSFLEKL